VSDVLYEDATRVLKGRYEKIAAVEFSREAARRAGPSAAAENLSAI